MLLNRFFNARGFCTLLLFRQFQYLINQFFPINHHIGIVNFGSSLFLQIYQDPYYFLHSPILIKYLLPWLVVSQIWILSPKCQLPIFSGLQGLPPFWVYHSWLIPLVFWFFLFLFLIILTLLIAFGNCYILGDLLLL